MFVRNYVFELLHQGKPKDTKCPAVKQLIYHAFIAV